MDGRDQFRTYRISNQQYVHSRIPVIWDKCGENCIMPIKRSRKNNEDFGCHISSSRAAGATSEFPSKSSAIWSDVSTTNTKLHIQSQPHSLKNWNNTYSESQLFASFWRRYVYTRRQISNWYQRWSDHVTVVTRHAGSSAQEVTRSRLPLRIAAIWKSTV